MMVYPGAFNTTTGPLHWSLLQQARALDNQIFVAAVSPARNPESTYQAYGHTSAVDPWGSIIKEATEKEELIVVDLDPERLFSVRKQIPTMDQKRYDVYSKPILQNNK